MRICVNFILVMLMLAASSANFDTQMWRRTIVSLARLYKSKQEVLYALPQALTVSPYTACVPRCKQLAWCKVWCLDASLAQCIFSDITLLEGYVETNLADAVSCYTTRKPDLATGATVTGSPDVDSLKVKTNLADGIYPIDISECFVAPRALNSWLVFDLGSVKTIRRVTMVMESNNNALDQANYEVRVGMVPATSSDLSAYQFFASFPGPAAYGEVVVMEAPTPIDGRYVSLQMLQDFWMVVCHVEIE